MQRGVEENIQRVEEQKSTLMQTMIKEVSEVAGVDIDKVKSVFDMTQIDEFAVEATILMDRLDEIEKEFENMPEGQRIREQPEYYRKRMNISSQMTVLALSYVDKTKNEFKDTTDDKKIREKILFSLETLMEYSGVCEDGAKKVPPAIKEMLKQDEPDYEFMRKLMENGLKADDKEWNRDLIYSLRKEAGGNKFFERTK
jgi:DNA-binding ferritin-like protein